MMFFLATIMLLGALVLGLLIAFANGMSDAPGEPGLSQRPMWIALALSIAAFVCWYFGWHPTW